MSLTDVSCSKCQYIVEEHINELRLLINTRAVTDAGDTLFEIEEGVDELSKEFGAYLTLTTSKLVGDRVNVSMSMHIMHTVSMEFDGYMDYVGMEVDSGNQATLVRGVPTFFQFKETHVPDRSDDSHYYLLFPPLCVIATLEKQCNKISYTFALAKPIAKMFITTVSDEPIYDPQEKWARKRDPDAFPNPPSKPAGPTAMDKWLEQGKAKRAKKRAELCSRE